MKSIMNRRESIKLMAAASLATALSGCTAAEIEKAADKVSAAGTDGLENRTRAILNAHEFETIRVLADAIIPRDEHSGSASDAGVPMFIDFLLEDVPSMQTPVTEGLAWLDKRCSTEFGNTFVQCGSAEQTSLLDRIAYPNNIQDKDLKKGAEFFSLVRNLTASGFFSSKMGMEDLQYMGNAVRPEWTGCPEEAMNHIGHAYET